jgi:mannopine transport system substrate-binding protein
MAHRRPVHKWPLVAVSVALILVAASCSKSTTPAGSSAGSNNSGKLIILGTGGAYERGILAAYARPFETATGVKVQVVEGGDNPIPQLQAQVQSRNVQWDVVVCGRTTALSYANLFAKIDRSIVTATGDLAVPDGVGDNRSVMDIEAFPIFVFSKDSYPDGKPQPKSWADFYNTQKFPGPRGLPDLGLDSAWLMPATALLAQGVAPNQLVPFDLNRAYSFLNAFKPHVRAFYKGFTDAQDLMRSREITMGIMTDGRGLGLVYGGANVGVVFNQGFRYLGSLCTPQGAPNEKNAMRFYQYILSHPAQQAVFSSITYYGPPTKTGLQQAQGLGLKDLSTSFVNQLIPDSDQLLEYIQKNQQTLLNRWNAYLQG